MKLDNFPIKRIWRHKEEWWVEPDLPRRRVSINSSRRNASPEQVAALPYRPRAYATGKFERPERWVPFSKIQGVDGGHIVPLYTLKEIGQRYRLTQATQKYWKKYILPEPFDVVRRRSVAAHHWSRITLVALETVLYDLIDKGYVNFTADMEDHIDMVEAGSRHLLDKYDRIAETKSINPFDKFGVLLEDM